MYKYENLCFILILCVIHDSETSLLFDFHICEVAGMFSFRIMVELFTSAEHFVVFQERMIVLLVKMKKDVPTANRNLFNVE